MGSHGLLTHGLTIPIHFEKLPSHPCPLMSIYIEMQGWLNYQWFMLQKGRAQLQVL